VPNIKLVRKADYLLCDAFVWEKTVMLGCSFGCKPKSKRLLGYPEEVRPRLTISDQEARSLSQAIQDCFDKLKSGRRPTRRQIAHLLLLEEGWDGNTFFVGLAEQMRRRLVRLRRCLRAPIRAPASRRPRRRSEPLPVPDLERRLPNQPILARLVGKPPAGPDAP
jgi:hypothetical protein